jgi:hypothetical protein
LPAVRPILATRSGASIQRASTVCDGRNEILYTDLGRALWSAPAEFRSERNGDGALAKIGQADDSRARTPRLAISQCGVSPAPVIAGPPHSYCRSALSRRVSCSRWNSPSGFIPEG